jgi:hypothetical protein
MTVAIVMVDKLVHPPKGVIQYWHNQSLPPPVRAKEETREERSRECKGSLMLWGDEQGCRRQGTGRLASDEGYGKRWVAEEWPLSNDAAAA